MNRDKKKSIFIAQTHEPETPEKKIITVDNYVFPPDAGKYTVLSHQAYLARIQKHDIQMSQISFSREIFEDFRKSINDALKEQREIDEWNNYLECDGYPHTYVPSEVREYLTKIEMFEKELAEKTDSWLLSINERSMLNQDMEAKFFTKNVLKNNKIDYGNKYDFFIGKLLGVLKRLETTIKTKYKVNKYNVLGDLNELRIATHYKIKDLIERFTYKIVSNTESQMKPITVQTSEFVCNTDNFRIYIWTFNNVPITIDSTRFQKVNIPIQCMNAKISLPFHILEPNLTLRVIQLNYDHYSDFVASYLDVSNPFRTNFREVLIMDWEKKSDLQLRIKRKLTEERAEYEEYLVAKAELEAKLKAQKKTPKPEKNPKKAGKKKAVVIPPEIEPDEFPDVDADFCKEEDEIYANIMENLHPKKYNFEENELNMRQFIPLGGIYEFNLLSKPNQIIYPFIATGLKTDVIPCILKAYVKKCPRKEEEEIDSIASEIDEKRPKVLQYYVLTVQIPTKYVKWAEPIPCQFIPGYDVIPQITREDSARSSRELSATQSSMQETPAKKSRKGRRTTLSSENRSTIVKARRTIRKSKKNVSETDFFSTNSETDLTESIAEAKDEANFSLVAIGTIRTTKRADDLENTTKWTTKYILKKKFNPEKGEMKIWTDRLGIFAFMYPRYIHFPFKYWSITAKGSSEVIYDIDTPLAKYRFKITDKGYVILVTNYYEKFSDRKTYLQILNPISDIDELKYTMIEQNLNIFPNIDAGYYLKGHFSQKLFALESHIYECMSAYSTFIQFHRSEWNCIAGYRNILLHTGENSTDPKETKPLHLVLQNLDEARYVNVEEVCTDISEILLRYKTARETDYCADLFNLITTSYPGSFFSRLRNAKLFLYVSEILKATKPLSFS